MHACMHTHTRTHEHAVEEDPASSPDTLSPVVPLSDGAELPAGPGSGTDLLHGLEQVLPLSGSSFPA